MIMEDSRGLSLAVKNGEKMGAQRARVISSHFQVKEALRGEDYAHAGVDISAASPTRDGDGVTALKTEQYGNETTQNYIVMTM